MKKAGNPIISFWDLLGARLTKLCLLLRQNAEAASPGSRPFNLTLQQGTFCALHLETHWLGDDHRTRTRQFNGDLAGRVAVDEKGDARIKGGRFEAVKLFFLKPGQESIHFSGRLPGNYGAADYQQFDLFQVFKVEVRNRYHTGPVTQLFRHSFSDGFGVAVH